MLLFLIDLINIENLRISFSLFYLLSFLILLLFVAELHQGIQPTQNVETVEPYLLMISLFDST